MGGGGGGGGGESRLCPESNFLLYNLISTFS